MRYLSLLLFIACRFDAGLPGDVVVSCQGDVDCPAGLTCDGEAKRCVTPGNRLMLTPMLSPALGRAGTVFTASAQLQAPGPLQASTVRVMSGTTELARFEASGTEWTWTYTATGDEPEGELRALAELDFGPGQRFAGLELGRFTLDFTPPRFSAGTLIYTPDVSSPLVQQGFASYARAASIGTTVQISLQIDEPPGAPPTAEVECSGTLEPRLPLSLLSMLERQVVFSGTLLAKTASASCEVRVRATDAAGNTRDALVPLSPTLEIDTDIPAAPRVDEPGAVVFHRAPQLELDGGAGGYWIALAAGAVDEPGPLIVSSPMGGVFARIPLPDSRVLPPTALDLAGDAIIIDVQMIDWAGNASTHVRVRDHEYVVSSLASGVVTGTPEPLPGLAAAAQLGPDAIPALTPNGNYTVFYSPNASGTLSLSRVTLAGSAGANFLSPPAPLTIPARTRGAATLEGLFPGRFLLFGGQSDAGALLDDLWETPTGVGTTLQRPKTGPWPAARHGHSFIAGDRPTLFGGEGAGGVLGDLWELTSDAGWRVLPSGPPARHRHGAAYLPGSGMVIVGGLGADGGTLDDLWRWSDAGWAQLPYRLPEGRADPQVAISSQGLAVAGGIGPFGDVASTLWVRDAGWVDYGPIIPRARGYMVWRQAGGLNDNTLIGGVTIGGRALGVATVQATTGRFGDAPFTLNNNLEMTRRDALAVYDPGAARVLFNGGEYYDPMVGYDYDCQTAVSWTGSALFDGEAFPDTYATGDYVPSRQTIVTLKSDGQLWELDGGIWVDTVLTTGGPWYGSPLRAARKGGLLAMSNGELLRLPDRGDTWQLVETGVPQSVIVFDYREGRGGLIALDGYQRVYEESDAGWLALNPAGPPSVHCATWDSDRQVFVAAIQKLSYATWWQWSRGEGWEQIASPAAYAPSSVGYECSVAYDSGRRRTVALVGDILEFDGWNAQAHLDVVVDPSVAGLGPSTQLTGIAVQAVAGGEGWTIDGGAVTGVELSALDRAAVASVSPSTSPALLHLDAVDAGYPRATSPFTVTVRAAAPNYRQISRVKVDRLNVLMHLRQ